MTIDLDDPVSLLLAGAAALEQSGTEAAAYGGLALAMYGEPRETRDADLAVATVDLARVRAALEAFGADVLVAFSDVPFGGCLLSRLSLVGGDQLNTIDLVIPRSPRYGKTLLSRSLNGSLRGRNLSVVSPEDFVVLKLLATRDRDLEDARSVLDKQASRIDVELIRAEVERLIVEIPDHEIRQRFDALLRRR